jgi:hypothetical protein
MKSLKQIIEERKARNSALAQADQANRCHLCRQALPTLGVVEDWTMKRRYCSFDCYERAQEREKFER